MRKSRSANHSKGSQPLRWVLMFKLSDEDRAAFADAVARAATDPALVAAVREVYAAFEAERAGRAPRCDQSGKCCRFEAHGHRLFVTTVEAAAFRAEVDARPVASVDGWDGTGCAYQVDGLCAAHDARPFGCRVYFCDPTSTNWQHEQYERFHAAIRELHERFGVTYWYAEWRDALAAIELPNAWSLPLPLSRERAGMRVRLPVAVEGRPSP